MTILWYPRGLRNKGITLLPQRDVFVPRESLADPGIYFGGPNQDSQSKVDGEARIEGAKRPSIEGKARVEGAKRQRIEGEARTEGKAQEKAGRGVWGGGSVSPSPENF